MLGVHSAFLAIFGNCLSPAQYLQAFFAYFALLGLRTAQKMAQ